MSQYDWCSHAAVLLEVVWLKMKITSNKNKLITTSDGEERLMPIAFKEQSEYQNKSQKSWLFSPLLQQAQDFYCFYTVNYKYYRLTHTNRHIFHCSELIKTIFPSFIYCLYNCELESVQKGEQKETLRRTDTQSRSRKRLCRSTNGFVRLGSASPGVLADLMVQELVEFDGFDPGSSSASVSETGQNWTQPHAVRRHAAFDRFT